MFELRRRKEHRFMYVCGVYVVCVCVCVCLCVSMLIGVHMLGGGRH